MDLLRLRTNIFCRPLAVHPEKLAVILAVIGDRLDFNVSDLQTSRYLEAVNARFKSPAKAKSQPEPYSVDMNGVAVIPVYGSLMNKTSGLATMSGCSSYEDIGEAFKAAMADPSVKSIVLDIDSPGGSTSGLFELCDTLNATKGQKPVVAVANDNCFSAAYAIASCADKIYVTRTGGVGSIGVFSMHVDQSQADKQDGLKYSYIKAGDFKTDGNPHEPLSDTARESMQKEVDRQYGMFTSLVAKNRNLSLKSVVGTEAQCYFGETALGLLADKVGTLDDAIASLLTSNNGSRINNNATVPLHMNKELNIDAVLDETLVLAATDKECADDEYMDSDDDMKKKEDDDEDEEDDDKMKKAVKASFVRIMNLCTLAGMPQLATSFIEADYTVEEVESALMKHRSKKSKAVKIASSTTTKTSAAVNLASAYDQIMADGSIKNKAAAYETYLRGNAAAYKDYLANRG